MSPSGSSEYCWLLFDILRCASYLDGKFTDLSRLKKGIDTEGKLR